MTDVLTGARYRDASGYEFVCNGLVVEDGIAFGLFELASPDDGTFRVPAEIFRTDPSIELVSIPE